ncbi:hypothetical protein Tco_0434723 [Tanacetum coccineum]
MEAQELDDSLQEMEYMESERGWRGSGKSGGIGGGYRCAVSDCLSYTDFTSILNLDRVRGSNRVREGLLACKYVRSGCTTALNVVPWETDGESVLREAMTNTQTPPHATTVVIPTGAPATNTVANHAERPEKFNGQNFKRWQQKMFFYLTTLGLARFLKETVPQTTTAKELWESLERKYKTEDAGTKKFVVEFKNYLKHKRKEMSVEDLVVRLRIEEDNKLAQKDTYAPDSAKANMVEHAGSSSRSNSREKAKTKRRMTRRAKGSLSTLAPKAGIGKQKFQGLLKKKNKL